MQVIENEVVTKKTVVLDDKSFVNGCYTECILLFGGGEFNSINTKFDRCQITFTGAAKRTTNLLVNFGMLKPGGGQTGGNSNGSVQ